MQTVWTGYPETACFAQTGTETWFAQTGTETWFARTGTETWFARTGREKVGKTNTFCLYNKISQETLEISYHSKIRNFQFAKLEISFYQLCVEQLQKRSACEIFFAICKSGLLQK